MGREDNEYGDLAVNFYGKSQFVDPQGNIVGGYGSEDREEVVVKIAATPQSPQDGAQLAGEVLAAVRPTAHETTETEKDT